MDTQEVKVVVRGIIKMLEAVKEYRMLVLENPYKFDLVCDACDMRAKFLRNMFTTHRKGCKFYVRRRLRLRNQQCRGLSVKGGEGVRINGKPVMHPNGLPWTYAEAIVDLGQVKYAK